VKILAEKHSLSQMCCFRTAGCPADDARGDNKTEEALGIKFLYGIACWTRFDEGQQPRFSVGCGEIQISNPVIEIWSLPRMSTIFYSWQSDRPTGTCRNFIERALQSAVDRLRVDVEVESALREDLEIDKDTKNVPGSPAIFDTIMAKIFSASIFVPDLTFVSLRIDERSISNPNVLIEYGYALHKPGPQRIIAVINTTYGEPTAQNVPFNLAHRRFPITYTLAENASEDERKVARKMLTDKFESALRTIFGSSEYTQAEAARTPSALDIAALHQKDLDYKDALSALRYEDGPRKVRENVEKLFAAIKTRCDEVAAKHDFGIESGWELKPRERFQSCVLRAPYLGIDVGWDQPRIDSLDDAKLGVREFSGRLYLPGEFQGGVHLQPPKMLSEAFYQPTLSTEYELGWVKAGKTRQEPSFIPNEELAEACVTQFLNLIRRMA